MDSNEFLQLGTFEQILDVEAHVRTFAAAVKEKLFGVFAEETSTKKQQKEERRVLIAKHKRRKDHAGRLFDEEKFKNLDVHTCSVDTLINQLGFHMVRLGSTI